MERAREEIGIKCLGAITVLWFFIANLFFQTNVSEDFLMSISDKVGFWDKYFEMLFYGTFAILFGVIYIRQIVLSIQGLKKEYFKYIASVVLFIIAVMVFSAILLTNCGIGDSANQEAISHGVENNKWITYLVVIVVGPFVEEMVFRYHIYSVIKGNNCRRHRVIYGVVLTSILFMMYHCDIRFILNFDYIQIISLIPLFFMGVGLAYIQEKTSNILCPIMVHMIINLISLT